MLPLESTASCGFPESGVSLERFSGAEKVVPPSVERLKKMSQLFVLGSLSTQTTLIAPPPSTAIRGLKGKPELKKTFLGVENATPPSVDRLNKIFELLAVSSSQTTLILPAASTATCGVTEKSE